MTPRRPPTLACLVALGLVLASPIRAAQPFADSPFAPAVSASADGQAPNQVAILSQGYDALLLRVHLIRQARTAIEVQTFIWTNDEVGRLLIYELIEAARRGVKVRIIADHMFSDQDPDIVAFLATVHPNFEVKHYRPAASRMKPSLWQTALAALQSFRGLNQRMHNKVMIFDHAILITGGRNVENTYFDHSLGMNFRDRDVVALGPLVHDAVSSFESFWNYRLSVPSRRLTDVATAIEHGKFRRYESRTDYDFGPYFRELDREANDREEIARRFTHRLRPVQRASFLSDEPGKSGRTAIARITRELRTTLERAKSSILIQSPYLVLSPPARQLFRDIQARNPGLRVQVSSNSFASTDNLFAYSGNYRLRNNYVEDLHLQIHEFKPHPAATTTLLPGYDYLVQLARAKGSASLPFLCLHAKSLVIDDSVAFIGSYNLDPRSESLNTEVGLLVEDPALARELRDEIEADMRPENSWVIGRREIPLQLNVVNGLIDEILSLGPLDLWPVQNTSSFELLPGASPVPADHPDFHRRYRDAGPFPGTDGLLSTKEILTRLYKAVGTPLTPVL